MTTTIYQESTGEAFISRSAFAEPTPITPISLSDGNGVAETDGFVLYLPLSSIPGGRKLVNIAIATQAISFGSQTTTGSSLKLYAAESSSTLTALNDRQSSYLFTAQETLFIPITAHLPQQVTVSNLQQSLESILLPKDLNSQVSGSELPTVYTLSQNDPTVTATLDAFATSSVAAATVSTTAFRNTLIGSIIGALVAGILIGSVLIVCLSIARKKRRRERVRSADHAVSYKQESLATDSEAGETLPMTIYGANWWIGLPLESSEDELKNGCVKLFNAINDHIADCYKSSGDAVSLNKIALQLDTIAYDDQFGLLDEEQVVVPFLQRMLASFIIARISLRSNIMDSFLPFDFTNIPKQKAWQMESLSDSSEPDALHAAFLPVFSGWRALTASLFDHEEHRSSSDLDAKVERAAREVASALSEYAKNKVNDRQRKSLEHIMKEACTIGLKIFANRSTFIFEWSQLFTRSDYRTIVVFPALVKILDENGQKLPRRRNLLRARTARI